MKAIEIKDGIKVSFEEFVKSASQMDTSGLEEFTKKLHQIIARRKRPNHSERELELIKIIYNKFPSETQFRYDELFQKLQSENISENEKSELNDLSKIAEEYNLKWLTAITELAQIRGISLSEVKKQLGLNKYPPQNAPLENS